VQQKRKEKLRRVKEERQQRMLTETGLDMQEAMKEITLAKL